jgi:hypothetical protein
VPIALEIGLCARALGLVDPGAPLPRSPGDVARLLRRIAHRAAGEDASRPRLSPEAAG